MLRWLLAFFGLPLLWALGKTLLQGWTLVFGAQQGWDGPLTSFVYGLGGMFVAYVLLHRVLAVTYVFAHEMTHLVVGLFFFARPIRIEIHHNEGCVELSKKNFFIVLAPYCVPFYFLLALGVQALIQWQWPLLLPSSVWVTIYGVFIGYHFLYTFESIVSVGQPDLREYGWLFSYWFILSMNFILATLPLLASPSKAWDLSIQCRTMGENTHQAYTWIYERLQTQYHHCFGSKEV